MEQEKKGWQRHVPVVGELPFLRLHRRRRRLVRDGRQPGHGGEVPSKVLMFRTGLGWVGPSRPW